MKQQMKMTKSNKAITLIALIITIIVLLILAGVSFNLLLGENGILEHASTSGDKYGIAVETEELRLQITNVQTEILKTTGKQATLEDLEARIDKTRYEIELQFESVGANGKLTMTKATSALVVKKGTNYLFTVDSKLVITSVETKEINIKFGNPVWENGKAVVTLEAKVDGTIEYQKGSKESTWVQGTIVNEIEHNTEIFVRVKVGNNYTTIESKIIKDIVSPSAFEIEKGTTTFNSTVVSLKTTPSDNETGLKEGYTYVAEPVEGSKIELQNITQTSQKIGGLEENTTYKVYVIAYDNAGNSTKSNEIEVTTTKRPVGEYYGKKVNYSAAGITDWKIFYEDDDEFLEDGTTVNPNYGRVYLITSNNLNYAQLTNEGKASVTTFMYKYSDTRFKWNSIPNLQTISNEIRLMFKYNFTGTATNAKCVSTLLNTSTWAPFAEGTSGVNNISNAYAIGSPTLEMFVDSWNDMYPTQKISCNNVNSNGYYVNKGESAGSSTSVKLSQYGGWNNSLYFYSEDYWLAAPSANNATWIMFVDESAKIGYNIYQYGTLAGYTQGIRPVVSIPSTYKLQFNENNNAYDIVLK